MTAQARGHGGVRLRPGMCQASGVLGLAIASAVSAAAWIYLVAAHGGFWRTGQRLPLRRAGTTPTTAGHDARSACVCRSGSRCPVRQKPPCAATR